MMSRRILGLQLVYIVHACHVRVHSCAAAIAHAHRALFNVDRAVYDTTYRDGKWDKVQTEELLPGDIASLGECDIHRRNFYINI